MSKVDTATYKLSGAIVRCLIGAGNRGRNDLCWGFAKVHFTNTHSPPPVYIWPPVKQRNVLYHAIKLLLYEKYFANINFQCLLPDLLNTISVTGNVCQWKTAVYGLVWNKLLHTNTRPVESPVATHSSSGCPAMQVGTLPVLPVLCLYQN